MQLITEKLKTLMHLLLLFILYKQIIIIALFFKNIIIYHKLDKYNINVHLIRNKNHKKQIK